MTPANERFLNKISVSKINFYNNTPCWNWIASKNKDGYGQFWANNKPRRAHRLSYELHKGKIPKGLDLDHLCRNRECVNPEHLEAVTHQENIRRGNGGLYQRLKTHCPQGHEYTVQNTYFILKLNGRRCKTCHRNNEKLRQRKLWKTNPDKIKIKNAKAYLKIKLLKLS